MTKTISDILETEIATLEAGQSLHDAVDMIMRSNEAHVFVIKAGKIQGMVSKTNLCKKLMQMIKKSSGHLVMDIEMKATLVDVFMTENVICLTTQMSLEEAVDILIKHNLRCCPVIDENEHPIGKITALGLLKEFQTSNILDV